MRKSLNRLKAILSKRKSKANQLSETLDKTPTTKPKWCTNMVQS